MSYQGGVEGLETSWAEVVTLEAVATSAEVSLSLYQRGLSHLNTDTCNIEMFLSMYKKIIVQSFSDDWFLSLSLSVGGYGGRGGYGDDFDNGENFEKCYRLQFVM